MKSTLLFVASGLMAVSAAAHGVIGWPSMRSALQQAGAGGDLIGGLAAGWYFGTVAMLAFSAIVFISGVRLRRGDTSGVAAVRTIAASYVIFGLAAFATRNFNAHFLLFVLTGVVTGAPVLGKREQRAGQGAR